MSSLAENLAAVKARIAAAAINAGRKPDEISLVAVSKTKPLEDIQAAIEAGQRDFGENYLQDALAKIDKLKGTENNLNWHFIGAIQSNKTRAIAENFDWVHTVEREKIAQRLNDQRPEGLAPLNALIQINLDVEQNKAGIDLPAALKLGQFILKLPNLKLRGLMFIPAPQTTSKARLTTCMKARELYEEFVTEFTECDSLSLGMSADLDEAITAGSNMVRIGTDIFGARD